MRFYSKKHEFTLKLLLTKVYTIRQRFGPTFTFLCFCTKKRASLHNEALEYLNSNYNSPNA